MSTQRLVKFLGLVFFGLPPATACAAIISTLLPFSVDNASMWSVGSGFSFERGGFIGGTFDAGVVHTSPRLNVSGTAAGAAGMSYDFVIDSGTVDVDYPVRAALDVPAFAAAGAGVVIDSSFTIESGARIETVSPTLRANVALPLRASVSASATLDAPGELFDIGADLSFAVNETTELLNIDANNRSVNRPFGQFGSIQANVPTIETVSALVGDTLVAFGSDQFANLSLDVDAIATTLIPSAPPLGINKDFSFLGKSLASIDVDLLDLDTSLRAVFSQQFSFDPELRVEYVLESGERADVSVGESFAFIMPEDQGESLSVTANYYLNNTFTNSSFVDIEASVDLDILRGDISLFEDSEVVDANVSFGPLLHRELNSPTFRISLPPNTFELHGFDLFSETFEIATSPSDGEVSGRSYGRFINPSSGVVSGVGTSSVRWGTPSVDSFASSLSFSGTNFTTELGEVFPLGVLRFRNGTILGDSGISRIVLELIADTTEDIFQANPLIGRIINTVNVPGNPSASADIVSFPGLANFHVFEGSSSSVTVLGQLGSLNVVGFGDVLAGDGFVTIGDPTLNFVPEPTSLALLVSGLVLAASVRTGRP